MIRSLVLEPIDETRQETGALRLSRFPCTIGRSHDCEPRLNLHRISRHHLRLEIDGDRIIVEDLGSTNGTFVNEERLTEPAELKPGDRLHIADYAFRVEHFSESESPASRRAGRPDTLSGQTIAGFTEDPTGFPVQAPQFYELLNDSLLEPRGVELTVDHNPREALLVTARSTHPALNAGHERLAHMARQLGEEARYHGILRELAVEAADDAGLDNRLIILPVDALEVEDAAVLLGELEDLAGRFKRLKLACSVRLSELDKTTLSQLSKSLARLGLVLAAAVENDEDAATCKASGIVAFQNATDAPARPLKEYF
ncbi:MAG: FHA domain-containing protein [Xanthomonadales bacterium]|nr:FHA domain-containing protein [Xanthomonadales bacterium]